MSIDPNDIDALINLSVCLSRETLKLEALKCLDKAISIEPLSSQAWVNKGYVYLELEKLNESLECFNKAIELNAISQEAFVGRGNLQNELKEYELALKDFNKALQFNPLNPQANWNKSLSLLRLGNFTEGWNLYESRWTVPGIKECQRHFSAPLWLGKESLKNKTILIHSEQGYGDTIQFSRYIPLLESMGAKVLLLTPKPLTKLMETLSATVRIIEDDYPEFETLSKKIDFHCPIMSLALAFKTTLETIPIVMPYLSADQGKCDLWFSRLEKLHSKNRIFTKLYRIGIAWNGSGHYAGIKNSKRDIPRNLIADLVNFFQGDEIEFHSLQIERDKNQEILPLIKGQFFNHDQHLHNFSDTAALLSHMDLVISVDTAVAHLAGALKVPTLLLIPDPPDFMSLTNDESSPWYPSISLLRQDKRGNWTAPLNVAKNKIAKRDFYAK